MAEPIAYSSTPEAAPTGPASLIVPGRVVIAPLEACGRLIVRGRETARRRASETLGVELPDRACRASGGGVENGGIAALWLGPDEWLVLVLARTDLEVARNVAAALAGCPHALVDVSDRQTAIAVCGPLAADILNIGCPLDLEPRAYPTGMCSGTLLGKAEIVLWRTGDEAFRIEVARSFSDYVSVFLIGAARVIIAAGA